MSLRFRVFGLGSKKRKVCTRRTCLFFCRLMMKKSSSIFHVKVGALFRSEDTREPGVLFQKPPLYNAIDCG